MSSGLSIRVGGPPGIVRSYCADVGEMRQGEQAPLRRDLSPREERWSHRFGSGAKITVKLAYCGPFSTLFSSPVIATQNGAHVVFLSVTKSRCVIVLLGEGLSQVVTYRRSFSPDN